VFLAFLGVSREGVGHDAPIIDFNRAS